MAISYRKKKRCDLNRTMVAILESSTQIDNDMHKVRNSKLKDNIRWENYREAKALIIEALLEKNRKINICVDMIVYIEVV